MVLLLLDNSSVYEHQKLCTTYYWISMVAMATGNNYTF